MFWGKVLESLCIGDEGEGGAPEGKWLCTRGQCGKERGRGEGDYEQRKLRASLVEEGTTDASFQTGTRLQRGGREREVEASGRRERGGRRGRLAFVTEGAA